MVSFKFFAELMDRCNKVVSESLTARIKYGGCTTKASAEWSRVGEITTDFSQAGPPAPCPARSQRRPFDFGWSEHLRPVQPLSSVARLLAPEQPADHRPIRASSG